VAKPSRVIALEEHFSTAEFKATAGPAWINDLGERRLADMDRFGVDMQVLSLSGPGVQGEADTATAIAKAKRANDALAEAVARHPKRFAGFACVPTQDPKAAADELERGVKQLGFKGAMIMAHTRGHYLDERMFDPLWERAEALDVPLYLHPSDGHKPWDVIDGYPELARATWGWSAETGAHALRIIIGGVFDRYPKARLILGHLGETIPFYLSRIDSRTRGRIDHRALQRPKLSDYIRQNVAVTTSGVFNDDALICTVSALGLESVMFAIDYPYEDDARAMAWLAALPLPQDQVEAIAHGNVERLLRL
jgi:2,3-dihydroxybenzoate decarboxylase